MKKIILYLTPILILVLSCEPTKKQVVTDEEATILLNRFMETMIKADTTLAEELLHPDCVFRYPLLPEPVEGIDGYKNLVRNMSNTFSDFNATIEEVNIKADRIWCRYSMKGVHSGPLGEVPATGKSFQITGMAITRLKDGKILKDETYWNALSFFQQLGYTLVPPNTETEK